MRIGVLTNILTPYRVAFFDLLAAKLTEEGGSLRVWVMADTEPGRPWRYASLQRPYSMLLSGLHPIVGGACFHFNPSVLLYIRDFRPDVLLQGGGWAIPTTVLAVAFRRLVGRPLTCFWSESHGREVRRLAGLKEKLWSMGRRAVYRRFDAFAVPGKFAAEFVDFTLGRKAPKILLPNVVAEDVYAAAYYHRHERKHGIRQMFGIADHRLVYIIPARLIPKKGILTFLQATETVLSAFKITILIAGEGPERREIAFWVRSRPELDVRLLGQLTAPQLVDMYTISDYLLLPSIADPNPLTTIEALWAGLPLLLSDKVGNWPEALVPGQNGFLFDPLQKESIRQAMIQSIEAADSWRQQAGRLSFDIARERFNASLVAEGLIRDLKQLRDAHITRGKDK